MDRRLREEASKGAVRRHLEEACSRSAEDSHTQERSGAEPLVARDIDHARMQVEACNLGQVGEGTGQAEDSIDLLRSLLPDPLSLEAR